MQRGFLLEAWHELVKHMKTIWLCVKVLTSFEKLNNNGGWEERYLSCSEKLMSVL